MKCLVTGATGFLGTNLVHELVERGGWEVRASGYPGSETKYIDHLPIEYVPADITNQEDVRRIVEGVEIVFHVAGDTSFWKKLFARQKRINVDGTRNIAEACLEFGVRRMIHTSTLDVLGYNPDGGTYNEETGYFNFDNMGYNYGETKVAAEELLKKEFLPRGLDVVFTCPGFMMGPFDYALQLGRVFFDLKSGSIPGSPPGGGSVCHVREVARGHVAAAKKGRRGVGYLLAGHEHTNLNFKELFARMAAAVEAKGPRFVLPRGIFVAYGYLMEFISNFTGKPPEMNPGQARYMSCPQYALSDRAMEELDYAVPSVEKCITDALDWYRANGYEI